MLQGSCNCGGVAFQISADLAPPVVCHCGQCRKQSGHLWASAQVPETALAFTARSTLRWYKASGFAKRGFCGTCGCFLFWKHNDEAEISIAMGGFDTPTGARLTQNIFVADKGDYYDINDGLPQQPH